jgi:hypothetical protein
MKACLPMNCFNFAHAALFELATTPARARVIRTDFAFGLLSLTQDVHDEQSRLTLAQKLCHQPHVRVNVSEEAFVTRTKVIQAIFAVRRFDEPVFRATAVASEKHRTLSAISRQFVPLVTPKLALER